MTKEFNSEEEKIIDEIMEAITIRIKKGSFTGGLGAKDFKGVIYYMFKREQ